MKTKVEEEFYDNEKTKIHRNDSNRQVAKPEFSGFDKKSLDLSPPRKVKVEFCEFEKSTLIDGSYQETVKVEFCIVEGNPLELSETIKTEKDKPIANAIQNDDSHQPTKKDEFLQSEKSNHTLSPIQNQEFKTATNSCSSCDKIIEFAEKNDTCECKNKLSSHSNKVQIFPGDNPYYVCNICDRIFSVLSTFQSHTRMHTLEKPHVCTICDKAFTVKSYLVNHMRSHSGEKPYKCILCDKKFSNRSGLHRHRRIHTGEKPYACMYCDKKFSLCNSLQSHSRLHTGVRPHACSCCDKAFNDKTTLQRHMRIHTGDKPYTCNIQYVTKHSVIGVTCGNI